jgi:hypothetical protein
VGKTYVEQLFTAAVNINDTQTRTIIIPRKEQKKKKENLKKEALNK